MKWILPEYVEDILPAEASRIESLRRKILDLFAGKKYELVMPPLLEYMDSLLTGTGHDLDIRTFKVVDQYSGRPMVLPEYWSTTLKVRMSRSCPVPVSSESMYSSSGGITSSYFFPANRSRIFLLNDSILDASAGRISSTYSGRIHFMVGSAPSYSTTHPQKQQQADDHRRQADEADLAVAHLRDAAERVAPERRRRQGLHAA